LANTIQSKKRARQSETHRQRNASARSTFRTYLKKVIYAIKAGNRSEAEIAYKSVVPILDRYATKGILHKNTAARHKSRLLNHIRSMAT
jgi:small subunit ribosomal protein S20